ncbi:hypothetical protein AGLY_007285 [Aphis glycines]|uniref:Uncharacterized protein n=1 Tax=Aphis glycines TaxID=307491 RepID=A0A6G0TP51_APHGL|nr:hypothetical protein AGLY_007285 [Aphis glycines]
MYFSQDIPWSWQLHDKDNPNSKTDMSTKKCIKFCTTIASLPFVIDFKCTSRKTMIDYFFSKLSDRERVNVHFISCPCRPNWILNYSSTAERLENAGTMFILSKTDHSTYACHPRPILKNYLGATIPRTVPYINAKLQDIVHRLSYLFKGLAVNFTNDLEIIANETIIKHFK